MSDRDHLWILLDPEKGLVGSVRAPGQDVRPPSGYRPADGRQVKVGDFPAAYAMFGDAFKGEAELQDGHFRLPVLPVPDDAQPGVTEPETVYPPTGIHSEDPEEREAAEANLRGDVEDAEEPS